MRQLFEDINKTNARMRRYSPLLAIDETLYPYRGHIGCKQYNPKKPVKYGLLYQSLCDSSIPYSYYSLPYASKPEKVEGPLAKCYITGTNEYSIYLINRLSVYCNFKGSISLWITTSHQFLYRHRLQTKTSQLQTTRSAFEFTSLKSQSYLLIGREDLSYMFITQKRKLCLFLTLIKRKV